MRISCAIFAAAILSIAFSSCNSSSDSTTGGSGSANPQTPDQALAMLSDQDRASLMQWEAQVIKACDANTIFSSSSGGNISAASGPMAVDAQILFSKTGNSLLIHGSDGSFALLGQPSYATGESQSSYQVSEQTGSSSYSVDAKTNYSNGNCELILYGQQVFSTTLFSQIEVAASFAPASLKPDPSRTVIRNPVKGSFANSQIGHLQHTGFGAAIEAMLSPQKADAAALLQSTLAISSDDVREFFVPTTSTLQGFLSVDGLTSISEFSLDDSSTQGDLLGNAADISSVQGPSEQTLRLTARLSVPSVQTSSASSSADKPLLRVSVQVDSAPQDGAVQYHVTAASISGFDTYDDAHAVQCFVQRNSLLNLATAATASPFFPAFLDDEGICDAWSADFGTAFASSPDALTVLKEKFAGISGSPSQEYQGWDSILLEVAARDSLSGRSLQATADPSSQCPIIDRISADQDTLRAGLAKNSSLAKLGGAQSTLARMISSWALAGTTPETNLDNILTDLNNSADPFAQSTLTLIADLGGSSWSQADSDSLNFAASLDSSYKTTASAFLVTSQGMDIDDFATSKFDSALQQKYTVQQFAKWTQELIAAKAFAGRDAKRAGPNEDFFQSRLKELITQGLNEGWSDANYRNVEAIAPIILYSDFCPTESNSSVSSMVQCDGDSQHYSTASGQFLDPSFGDRYARASAIFQDSLKILSGQAFFADRNNLISAFFGPVWSSCSGATFESNLQSLSSLAQSLSQADPITQFGLENQLQALLQDCTKN